METRDCSHNAGFISLAAIPVEEYVAGVIVVTIDDDGEYGTHFIPESLDEVPDPEVQKELGKLVTQAWATANLSGLVLDDEGGA